MRATAISERDLERNGFQMRLTLIEYACGYTFEGVAVIDGYSVSVQVNRGDVLIYGTSVWCQDTGERLAELEDLAIDKAMARVAELRKALCGVPLDYRGSEMPTPPRKYWDAR